MSNYQIISMKEIVKNYSVLLIDIWGVLFDGLNPYPGVPEYINSLIEDGKKIIFLSNNPRPKSIAEKRFESWGIDMSKAEVYTSGDAVREQFISWDDEVFRNLGKKCYHLGSEVNQDILSGIEAEVVTDINQADFLLITAYVDDIKEIKIHNDILKKASELGLVAICANPDLTAQQGDETRYCAGTFGKKYEEMGGLVHYYGKPDPRVYEAVFTKYLNGIDKSEVLMIGDTIDTDILGASRFGIDSALVLTGNGGEFAQAIDAGQEDIFVGQSAVPTWISPQMV